MADYDDYDDLDEELDQEPEEEEQGPRGGFLDSLQDQFGAAPWWVMSMVLHALILALLATIVIVYGQEDDDTTVVQIVPAAPKPPEIKERKPRDIQKQDKIVEHENEVKTPMISHEEVEVTDHMETENEMELNSAQGQEDAISDIPLGGTGV